MKKTCPNGHLFEKSSDCPVCPVCEKARKPHAEFPKMGAPALRALANAGITGPDGLKKWNEVDILALHGMGPKAMRSDFDLSWWLPNLYLLLYPIYFVQALAREKL